MTIYGAKDLAAAFRTVRKNTLIIAEEIPEEKYSFRATPDNRSVAETLVHIAQSPGLQLQVQAVERRTTLEGFDFFAFIGKAIAEEKTPRTKAQILELLKKEGDRFASWLEGVSDDFLAERVAMPTGMEPASKTRFEMLMGVKEHEMHHRGQLMVTQRMLGLVPHLTRQMQAMIEQMTAQKAKASA